MRIRVPQSRRRMDRITVNLAAMIDVSFLLLFYFMVASVLGEAESRLNTAVKTQSSDAGSSPASDFQPQTIEVKVVDGVPAYALGSRIFRDRQELADALAPLPRGPGLLIHVHDHVPVAFAITAVQAAKDSGFEQVTYVPGK